jgi:hypothetical protein
MFLIANCKNCVSSYEVGRDTKVTQRSAWFMLQRIRHVMHTGTFNKLSGQIEADESQVLKPVKFPFVRVSGRVASAIGRSIDRDNGGRIA